MLQSINTEEIMQETMDDEEKEEMSKISEIIENSDIEEDDKERIIGIIRQEIFKGPIPHPRILQQYEEIHPGFASEIINMAVKEQEHRHSIEKTIVESEALSNTGQMEIIRASITLKIRLQIFGFVSTAILLIAGVICILLDKDVGSITTFILAIGSFCWTMFYGKKNDKEEKENSEDSE